MKFILLVLAIMIAPGAASAQTFFGVLTTPANTGPGGSCCSSVATVDPSNASIPNDGTCVGCSVITKAQYDAFQAAVNLSGKTNQSALEKLSTGITLTCSAAPSLTGTYDVNQFTMNFLNTIVGYYVANGNTLPAAAQQLTILDTSNNLHSFPNATALTNFYKAVGGYWLQLINWRQRTIAGESLAVPTATSSAC
jgi:hypothetical protein